VLSLFFLFSSLFLCFPAFFFLSLYNFILFRPAQGDSNCTLDPRVQLECIPEDSKQDVEKLKEFRCICSTILRLSEEEKGQIAVLEQRFTASEGAYSSPCTRISLLDSTLLYPTLTLLYATLFPYNYLSQV